jgi:DNA-binding NarL/FixJ family response regulator
MAATSTLLCIHRDPTQLTMLTEKGYGVISTTNGSDGLRVLMLHPVDAVVLEYYLGLLNGAVVADEIKQVRPQIPIVMVADPLELPEGSLKSVDAIVARSAGPYSLLETIHSVLQTKRLPQHDGGMKGRTRQKHFETLRLGRTRPSQKKAFSEELWKSIWSGSFRF